MKSTCVKIKLLLIASYRFMKHATVSNLIYGIERYSVCIGVSINQPLGKPKYQVLRKYIQPATRCSQLAIEALEQGEKYVESIL